MTTNALVFISYSQFDDDFEDGALSRFRDALSRTLRFVSGGEVAIFQEGTGIEIGQPVQERISQSLSEAMVLVPIITPNFFTDPTCQNILTHFLERERQLERNDLVLAVYYQQVPQLNAAQANDDSLFRTTAQRRLLDWQPLRGKEFNDLQVRHELERLAQRIIALLDELKTVQQAGSTNPSPVTRSANTEHHQATELQLSSELIDLLGTFVQAARSRSRYQRQPFIFASQSGNDKVVSSFVKHPGLSPEHIPVYRGDLDELIEARFLRRSTDLKDGFEFDITNRGFNYYDQQVASSPPRKKPAETLVSPPATAKEEPVLLTLRFTPNLDGATITCTWESIAGGTSTSFFALPYTSSDLPLVIKALDAAQHPAHPHHGPQFSPEEQQRLHALGLWQQGRVPSVAHKLVGQQLYAALIEDRKGEIAFSTVRNAARSQGQPLTYVLRFPADAVELAALPWEALRDKRQAVLLSSGSRHLDSLERYLDLDEALSPPLPQGKKLYILALSPHAGIPQAIRDEERAARLQSWEALKARGLLEWDELSPVTTQALDDRMRQGHTPDIIHYYGHGIYKHEQGSLLLDSATTPGHHEFVSAQRLAALLGGIRLIVIHACQSAMVQDSESQSGLLTGLAPALSAVSEAVVAMQLTIRISAATRFAEVFYAELAQGRSVQAAVADARRSLYAIESDGASWYVPTLYIRTREQKPLYFVQG